MQSNDKTRYFKINSSLIDFFNKSNIFLFAKIFSDFEINKKFNISQKSNLKRQNFLFFYIIRASSISIALQEQYFKMKHSFKKQYYNTSKKWHEISTIQKIYYLYELPLNILRDLTIPIPNESMWSKRKAVLNPIFCSLLVLLITGCKWKNLIIHNNFVVISFQITEGFYLIYLILPISGLISLLVYKFTNNKEAPFFISVCYFCYLKNIFF